MIIGRMERYCIKHGHNWAIDSDIGNDGWVIILCMTCGAKQLAYIEEEDLESPPEYMEVNYDTDMDDDRSERQAE